MQKREAEHRGSESAQFVAPYPPGWVDRLTGWVDRLPGSSWQYYLALFVVQLLYVTILMALDDNTPLRLPDLRRVFFIAAAPYFLWVRSYLDRVASAALAAFRSALEPITTAEYATLHYGLMTLPARHTRFATALAALICILNIRMVPTLVGEYTASVTTILTQFVPLVFIAVATTLVCTAHAAHQLRMVTKIHGLARQINLFQPTSLYAFSGLTARTGLSFVLLAYYLGVMRPDLILAGRALAMLVVILIPVAIASFIVPLHGMHRRLAAEKQRLLGEASHRFEVVTAALHQRIDTAILADADKLNMQLTSLTTERAALEKLSTWPWEPQTLTGFVSTLVVPIILWFLNYVLE